MIIEQTVEIPADRRIFLDLPHSIPVGVRARIEINIPAVPEIPVKTVQATAKSFRGILKGRGITLERFREMQREDKALEDKAEDRRNEGTR
jgi:hypothetical protein